MAARVEGRVAFITGAGMGIGRETALLFAEEGAGVVVGDIDANAAKETVALVEGRGGRALAPNGDAAIEADGRERESTRLDTRHPVNSYARFCLEKKNTAAYEAA